MSEDGKATGSRASDGSAGDRVPAYRLIGGIAGRRSGGWRALASALAPPTPAFVEELSSGRFLDGLATAVDWLGPERERFRADLATLASFDSQTAAMTPEEALRLVKDEHRRLVGKKARRASEIAAYLADRCAEEQAAWQTDQPEEAKAIRVEERRVLDLRIEELRECAARLGSSELGLYRAAAGILVGFAEMELGGPG
jgi:hypothetical protein